MDHSPSAENEPEVLIRLARQCFLQSLCSSIPELDRLIVKRFEAADDSHFKDPGSDARAIHVWLQDYMQHRRTWAQNLLTIWRAALIDQVAVKKPASFEETTTIEQLSLISNDAIEGMIASSRLNVRVLEVVEPILSQLRKRLLSLNPQGLSSKDAMQPLVVAQSLMDAWETAQLDKRAFVWVMDAIAQEWAAFMFKAYEASDTLLKDKGIQPFVRPTPAPTTGSIAASMAHAAAAYGSSAHGGLGYAPQATAGMTASGTSAMMVPSTANSQLPAAYHPAAGAAYYPAAAAMPAPHLLAPHMRIPGSAAIPPARAPLPVPAAQFGQASIQQMHALWSDIRLRLEQVIGPSPAPNNPVTQLAPSIELVEAMGAQQAYAQKLEQAARPSALLQAPDQVSEEVAQLAKQQSEALKQESDRPNEKAVIEMVALMFQSVIAEARVPASVRVLFARLQVPVLRIALSDSAFFSDENHPARRLIDRMGSAAMGFDGANFQGSALELELSRIVQMIEQYPDTGIKVFQLALNEFEKFLQKFLAENRQAGKAISVAQQVEEKETLLVKFTIELRNMLQDLPIKDEVRSFLFKTWAEVLAVSAVRSGPQSPETQKHKQTAALLVWAIGTTSSAQQRRRVAQALPGLRTRLRAGLAMIGVTEMAQEAIQTQIVQAIQNAFLMNTEGMSMAKIEQISARLKGLENLVSADEVDDIALSPENIEMMTGLELVGLVVIAEPSNTGVSEEVLQWAKNRAIGEWFYLAPKNANDSAAQPGKERKEGPRVQYAWHSAQRHLHLLLMPDGRSLLMKLKTFAVCLAQGQLIPLDQEGLMLRATRKALSHYQPASNEPISEAIDELMTELAVDDFGEISSLMASHVPDNTEPAPALSVYAAPANASAHKNSV